MPATARIEPAESPASIAEAAVLFREYADSLPFSLCFQGFEEELAALPGKYAAPGGVILLARDERGTAVGCVAMRPIEPAPGDDAPVCEMKRMYVRPSHRGQGLGRQLAESLLARARAAGYRTMKLDSEDDFKEAVGLYRSLGFVDIPRYNDDPNPHTVFLGVRL